MLQRVGIHLPRLPLLTVLFPGLWQFKACSRRWRLRSLSKIRAQLAKRFTSSEAWLNENRSPDKRHALRNYFQQTTRGQNQRQDTAATRSAQRRWFCTEGKPKQQKRLQKQKNTHTTTKKTILGLSCVAVIFVISRCVLCRLSF